MTFDADPLAWRHTRGWAELPGLATEVRYLSVQDGAVLTTLGALDSKRVAAGLPVRKVRSHAGDRHY